MVRQCHSPEPMGQQQTAEDIVADGGRATDDAAAEADRDDEHTEER